MIIIGIEQRRNVNNDISAQKKIIMPKRKSNLTTGKRYKKAKYQKNDLKPTCNWDTQILQISNGEQSENIQLLTDTETSTENADQAEEDEHGDNNETCDSLFHDVLGKLKKVGQDFFLLQFFKLIAQDSFPFESISFILFGEFIQWLSVSSTSGMRYSDDSKEFWWVGKMLFGSKFIRFMQGFKHKGRVTMGTSYKGLYNPLETTVNFAVPSESVLAEFCPLDGLANLKLEIDPGAIEPIIELYSSNGKVKSHVLTFDGKKVIPNTADIDLLGCEDSDTCEMQNQIKEDESCIQRISELESSLQTTKNGSLSIDNLEENEKAYLVRHLKHIFHHIGIRLQKVKEIKRKKEYALSKLEEKILRAPTKDQYLINHLKSFVYQCSITIGDVIDNIDNLCEIIAMLVGGKSNFVKGKVVDLGHQGNFTELLSPADVREVLNISEDMTVQSRFIKQRSDEWFDIRKTVKVTGSQAHCAVGLDTLKEQKLYFDQIFSNREREKTNQQETAMAYGTENEINGVATLVAKIMPVLYPHLMFCEEGVYMINDADNIPFVAVSPDGSLRRPRQGQLELDDHPEVGIEIKYPYSYRSQGFSIVPKRYLCQCFLEQTVLNCGEQLMIRWTPESTSVFKVPCDKPVVQDVLNEIKDIYYTCLPRRPTKMSETSKQVAIKLEQDITKCTFVGEFKSVTVVEGTNALERRSGCPHRYGSSNESKNELKIDIDVVCKVLLKSKNLMGDLLRLYKKTASEAVVFSLADTDRTWKREVGHGMPIGYFFKGYSLSSDCMRNISEKMLRSCLEADIHIPCITFDGQWYKLKDETNKGKALSLFELQRKYWKSITSMTKDELLIKLCEVRKRVFYEVIALKHSVDVETGAIWMKDTLVLYSGDECLQYPGIGWKGKETHSNKVGKIDGEVAATLLENVVDNNSVDITELFDRDDDEDVLQTGYPESAVPADAMDEESNPYVLTQNDCDAIKEILLRSSRKKCPFRPNSLSHDRVISFFKSENSMKSLTDLEIKNIILYLNVELKKLNKDIPVKGNKTEKIVELCKLFGISYESNLPKYKKKSKLVPSLLELTKRRIKCFGKLFLASVYAKYHWNITEKQWRGTLPIGEEIDIEGLDYHFKPIYTPQEMKTSDGVHLYVTCLDGHHIRTNIRAKICKDGTDNLKRSAWISVAKSQNTNLSCAMIEPNKDGKILDQQSDRFVRTMFSENVEIELSKLGYESEAQFTKLLREWHEAEDLPGLSAIERCKRSLSLRSWLLQNYQFGEFPPSSSHINGFPRVTFEGLICSIEAHLFMYELCKNRSYNWRSVSTLVAENVFGEISEMENHSNGVPSGASFKRNMAIMTGLHGVRLKPDRKFCMQTAKSRVYPIPQLHNANDSEGQIAIQTDAGVEHSIDFPITKIRPRNHEFDIRESRQKTMEGFVSSPFDVPRGVKPVRHNYKVDESRLLWSSRMGLESEQLS